METYETIIIFDTKVDKKENTARAREIEHMIQDWSKHKRVFVDFIGKKPLAYAIRDNEEGFYVLFKYQSHPAHIRELEEALRANPGVLKFLTVKRDEISGELLDYIPEEELSSESEQDLYEKPDALDVLLGLATY